MQLGTTYVDVVSDGTYHVDGGAVFGLVPRVEWEFYLKPDRKNRVRLGLNCLLIRMPNMNILVGTGAGTKQADKLKDTYGLNGNKLQKGLKKLGITSRDIDFVILPNLQFDTVGGATKLDRSGNVVPTFQKAKHLVQRAAWDEANSVTERNRKLYNADDFVPLEEQGLLTLLDEDYQIAPGVRTQVTGGYTAGHQIVLVEVGSERIAFMSNLIPTPFHTALPTISAFDKDPSAVLEQKRRIVGMAVSEGWLMIFWHAQEQVGAYIEERNGKSQLLPVAI